MTNTTGVNTNPVVGGAAAIGAVNATTGGGGPASGYTLAGLSGKQYRYVQKFEVDLSLYTFTTGQSIYLMPIPAYTQVDFMYVQNATALSLSSTPSYSVGDTGSNTRFVSGYTTMTAAAVATQALTVNPLLAYGATSDKLLLTLTAGGGITPATGIIRFVIGLTDITRDAPMTTQ